MQIQSVLSGYTDPTTKRQAELIDAVTGRAIGKGDKSEASASLSKADTARDILDNYDVTEITPSQYTEMIQQLFDAGAITHQEFEQLATIRLDLDSAGIDPNESVDLLQFYRDKVDQAQGQNSAAEGVPAALVRRLDWIEKFAMMQGESDSLGIDTFA